MFGKVPVINNKPQVSPDLLPQNPGHRLATNQNQNPLQGGGSSTIVGPSNTKLLPLITKQQQQNLAPNFLPQVAPKLKPSLIPQRHQQFGNIPFQIIEKESRQVRENNKDKRF